MNPCAARLAGVAALVLVAGTVLAAGDPAPAPGPAPSAPPPTLGVHAPMLEGTWDLVSMTLPGGQVLAPPAATGVIVVDGTRYLAASYVMAAPRRRVGSLWQGPLSLDGERFRVDPKTGFRYDSARTPPVFGGPPPPTEGRLALTADGLVFTRDDGGTTTWDWKRSRRVQQEPDGTVIEHRRTSLVPRVPDDLPGRAELTAPER